MKGLFISIEGPDGSGKSTQIQNIKKYFQDKGREIIFTREPGGTAIGERIRAIILDNKCSEMDFMTEAMLYAASRAQHVAQVIRPALNEGKIVICDRFVDSSIAYQGYGRGLGEAVSVINNFAIGDCIPDMTFLLKLSPDVGKTRIEKNRTDKDRLEHERLSFHMEVYKGYLAIEKNNPDRIIGIDATRGIDEIKKDIYLRLDELLLRERV